MRKDKGFRITDHDHKNVIDIANKIIFLQNATLHDVSDPFDLVKSGYLRETISF